MPSWDQRLALAVRRSERAMGERDELIREAHRASLSLRRIAEATGLSHQRVHQIVHRRS